MNLWTLIDEKKIAEDLVKDFNEINKNTNVKIKCYIKYLKNEKNMSKVEIRNEIDNMLIKYLNGFIMADKDESLQNMVNKYTKNKNCEYKTYNNSIVIYKEELDIISNIGNLGCFPAIDIERVLFIMLVLAKSNNSEWVNYSSRDIFKLAKFKYKTKSDKQQIQREKLIYDLAHYTNDEILKVTNFGTSPSLKLLFIKNDGEEVMRLHIDIDSIDNIILHYLNWRNKNKYYYCIECGKEITVNSKKPRKYCSSCSKKIKNIQNKMYYKK